MILNFFDNVAQLYLNEMRKNKSLAIVGDLGGSRRCPFGPCGEKCSPNNILLGKFPNKNWPITGHHSLFHTILGRYKRNCRINEWCCMINVSAAKELAEKEGTYFGNYEGGGDVATYWFDRIIAHGYEFTDPLPTKEKRAAYYLHWWQGHMGHSVWVDQGDGSGKCEYEKDYIIKLLYDEFGFEF